MQVGEIMAPGVRVCSLRSAGTGLASIVSVLAGAEQTVISDYPAPELLTNIKVNVKRNIPAQLLERVSVESHE